MARIKEYPSITSIDGTNDALAIEQTDGANNRLRKVSPAQLKQYMTAELTANTLTGINIAAYNSAANQFTAPTDGYVRMELRNANQYFYLNVNNATLLGGEGHNVTNANDYMTIFIKKGMRLYYTGTVHTAIFYSLT